MTGYEMAAIILGVFLALLFGIYARAKRNDTTNRRASSGSERFPGQNRDITVQEPDIVSKAAGGIFKAHKIWGRIMAIVIIGAVLLDAVFDPMTRVIVLSSVCLMLLIAVIWVIQKKRK